MQYVGIQTQKDRNNRNSILLLLSFPCIILGMLWVFCCVFGIYPYYNNATGEEMFGFDANATNEVFMSIAPWAVGIVAIWMFIAYNFNTAMIRSATKARPLERRENPRIYNIVENLCMTCGMDMPQINIVDDPQLNAFASGINKSTYTVTLTTGIINYLDDEELAGVIGHELTHIRNNDTKVLIISIVFVGIVSTLLNMLTRGIYRMSFYSSNRRSDRNGKGGVSVIVIVIAAIICSAIAYLLTTLTRFAISRKREFMADAGGAELCGNPRALASALRKISRNPGLGDVNREDIAQLYIIHPTALSEGFFDSVNNLFSTHPDTAERIRILEQF